MNYPHPGGGNSPYGPAVPPTQNPQSPHFLMQQRPLENHYNQQFYIVSYQDGQQLPMGMRIPYIGSHSQPEIAPAPGWSPQKLETPASHESSSAASQPPEATQSDGPVRKHPLSNDKFVSMKRYNDLLTYTNLLQDLLASMDSRIRMLEKSGSSPTQGYKREPADDDRPRKRSRGN